jgi:hypothetical protein
MTLMRNRVRVDKADADALLSIILTPGRGDGIGVPNAGLDTAAVRLRAALQDAYPVPLTDQVRLPQALVRELIDALRAAADEDT